MADKAQSEDGRHTDAGGKTGVRTALPGSLGRAVRKARLELGWTQEELALAVGITGPAISCIENSGGVARENRLKLAEVLEAGHSYEPPLTAQQTAEQQAQAIKAKYLGKLRELKKDRELLGGRDISQIIRDRDTMFQANKDILFRERWMRKEIVRLRIMVNEGYGTEDGDWVNLSEIPDTPLDEMQETG